MTPSIELVDAEGTLLREIADPRMKRDDVALTYAMALKVRGRETIHWRVVNEAIMERWSRSALIYIKERAWKLFEGRA